MDENLLKVRRRLRDSFPYYGPRALVIRTKDGKIIPFRLNRSQRLLQELIDRQMAEMGMVRIIVLKARQLGLSTFIGGYLYFLVSQTPAVKAMVIAHKTDSTRTLFDMTKRYHTNCPEALRPSTKYSSRQELVFEALDSQYMVATAGGDGIARGETITYLHASELAFWPTGTQAENWNSLSQSVPNSKGTAIFVESTANGVTGKFYELCQGALDGTNSYSILFLPWFFDETGPMGSCSYYTEPPAPLERTPEEQKLAALALERYSFVIEDGHLYWRRKKIVEVGPELFQQEYPTTVEEAFLTTGRPVFNPTQLQEMLEVSPLPLTRMAVEGETLVEHPLGELYVYRKLFDDQGKRIDRSVTYCIGADVGGGVKGDPSVAQIFDTTGEQVAVWRGQILPDHYAYVLDTLGKFFNYAPMIVESNNHGILPLHILSKELNYPNLYQDTIYDQITDTETKRLGFSTTVKSKPMLIDKYRGALRAKERKLKSAHTIREHLTFVVKASGKMEAEEGCHDDEVMAAALASFLIDEQKPGIPVRDEHYEEGY